MINLEQGCVWSDPGTDKWQGDDLGAIKAMGIPEPAAYALQQKILMGQASGTATINDRGVVDQSGNKYQMTYTTHGQSVCQSPKVTFRELQQADMYVFGEYHVMVPRVCHNVSRVVEVTPPPKVVWHSVPEPGTWLLMLPVVAWMVRRVKR